VKGTWDARPDPLEALREGDPGPFEAFVGSEASTFVAFFLRLGAGRDQAEDLTQDVFLKLFRHAETYEAHGRFGAFSMRIARNAWIDHTRRASVRPRPAAGSLPGDDDEPSYEQVDVSGGTPGERIERDDEARRVTRALARLSEPHRLVFELGVVQELPYPEIAEALSIPVGTVKSRMHHAVRKLRDLLTEEVPGELPGDIGMTGPDSSRQDSPGGGVR